MHRSGWFFLLALSALVGLASVCVERVAAQPRSPDGLRWEVAPGCPGADALTERISRLLAHVFEVGPTTTIEGAISEIDSRQWLELRITRDGEPSVRRVEGESCEELTAAAALLIALAIDPDAVAARAELEANESTIRDVDVSADTSALGEPLETAPEAPPSDAVVATSERATDLPPPRRDAREVAESARTESPRTGSERNASQGVRFLASGRALLSAGPLPAPSPGAGAVFGVGIGPVEITAGGGWLAEQGTVSSDGRGGTFSMAYARVRACGAWLVADAWVELMPCVALDIGGMWGYGAGVDVVRSGRALWASLAIGAEARVWVADSLAIAILADLSVPFVRSPFILTVDGSRIEVHRPFEVGGLFGLGLTLRIR